MFIEIASRSTLPNGGGPMLTTRPLQYLDPSALADRASNEGAVRGSMAGSQAIAQGAAAAAAAVGQGLSDMGKQKMQKEAYAAAREQQGFENQMAQRSASQRDAQIAIQKEGLGSKEDIARNNFFSRGLAAGQNINDLWAAWGQMQGGQPKPNGIDVWRSNLNQAPTTSFDGTGVRKVSINPTQ